jgi:hypothetical protein
MSVQDSLRQIEGLPCHDFKLVAGGSLILYIGTAEPPSSITEWRLHIDSAWRLDGVDGPLLGSFDTLACEQQEESITERCLVFLRSLVGRRLLAVAYAPPAGDLTLEFEGGNSLRTFSHATESDAWELRHRSGRRYGLCDCTYREWQEDADAPHAS